MDQETGFEKYREYLRFLARVGLDPRLRARLDPSDIVQDTFLEAYQARRGYEERTAEAEAAWLRRILAHNLANAHRDHHREKRDVDRERSIEAALDRSSIRLGGWLAASDPSPSRQAMQ